MPPPARAAFVKRECTRHPCMIDGRRLPPGDQAIPCIRQQPAAGLDLGGRSPGGLLHPDEGEGALPEIWAPHGGGVYGEHVRELGVSERKVGAVMGQHRSTQRTAPGGSDDEAARMADIVHLAKRHGRYGYRRITALLRDAGWALSGAVFKTLREAQG
jgi:hypothetical protein